MSKMEHIRDEVTMEQEHY